MRRGSAGRPSTARSVSSASKCAAVISLKRVRYDSSALRVASSTSARLSPRCGTRIRDPAPGARRQPLLHRLGVLDLHRQVDLRRRHAHARRTACSAACSTSASPPASAPGVGRQLDALDDAAAAHREDLDGAAARPDLQAEHVAIAELRRSPPSAAGRAASAPCASRRAAAPPPRSAPPPRPSAIRSRSVSTSSSVAPFEQQPRVRHRHAVAAPRCRSRRRTARCSA